MDVVDLFLNTFGSIIMIIVGSFSLFLGITTHQEQIFLKKKGIKTRGIIVGFSVEKSTSENTKMKIPIISFTYNSNYYRVKSKSTSKSKIGEEITLFFNPDNPEKEFFCPEKDFLIKYVLFFIGSFFFCLGLNYLLKNLSFINSEKFSFTMLILIGSLISISILIYGIGLLKYQNKN